MAISFLPVMATGSYPHRMNPEPESETVIARVPIESDLWEEFRLATRAKHASGRSPRAKVLREFVEWYVSRPGAKPVKRPDAGSWSTPGE